MSDLDDARAENTAFDLLEIKQAKRAKVKQREGWDGKEPVIKATITIPFNTYSAKDENNEK